MRMQDLSRRSFLSGALAGLPGLSPGRRARAAIVIRLNGGLSQLDSFDPKPEAPREIRGPFAAISTGVPGLRFCEHLPRLARRARRLTILRSLCSDETQHERAARRMEVAEAVAGAERIVPGAVCAQASAEWERYGRSPLGAACLAARSRIEAGVRLVTVEHDWPGYDTHAGAFCLLGERLLPELDWALAALLDDLAQRGLLESTLVLAVGEFGRTPGINAAGGRDHHSGAWSALLAGGGLAGGRVLGATDRHGYEVRDLPVAPEDLARTVLALLGCDPGPYQPASRGRVIREVLEG